MKTSTTNDWKKLQRLLKYVEQTIDDIRVIWASSMEDLFSFIEATYTVRDNKVDKGEIIIKYCPTYVILAVYFIKPLHGIFLKLFREIIMRWKPATIPFDDISLKEHLEDQDILLRNEAHNMKEDQDNKSVSEISPRKIDDVSNER